MKTAEEAAKEIIYDFLPNDRMKYDIQKQREGFVEGYNYRESFVAAEREEAVKEYKKKLILHMQRLWIDGKIRDKEINTVIDFIDPKKTLRMEQFTTKGK